MYRLLDFSENVPEQLCKILFEEQLQSVIIEGGFHTLSSFIQKRLWDEARIFVGDTSFGEGLQAPTIQGSITDILQISNNQLTLLIP